MKPPEKLYGYIRDNNFWLNHPIDQPLVGGDIEYHRASQWISVKLAGQALCELAERLRMGGSTDDEELYHLISDWKEALSQPPGDV